MATSWSNLHTSKIVQPPAPSYSSSGGGSSKLKTIKQKQKLPSTLPLATPMLELDDPLSAPPLAEASRSSSLAGRKRPRESDSPAQLSRRTKSVGAVQPKDKDREAFQRGLIAVFVPKALKDSVKGDNGNYNDLLAHFLPTATNPNPPLAPLLPLLRAVSGHVSALVPDRHGGLVSAILGLPWAYGDERFVKTYIGWAGVLVSAHPSWTKEVVQMAIKGLAWRKSLPFLCTASQKDQD